MKSVFVETKGVDTSPLEVVSKACSPALITVFLFAPASMGCSIIKEFVADRANTCEAVIPPRTCLDDGGCEVDTEISDQNGDPLPVTCVFKDNGETLQAYLKVDMPLIATLNERGMFSSMFMDLEEGEPQPLGKCTGKVASLETGSELGILQDDEGGALGIYTYENQGGNLCHSAIFDISLPYPVSVLKLEGIPLGTGPNSPTLLIGEESDGTIVKCQTDWNVAYGYDGQGRGDISFGSKEAEGPIVSLCRLVAEGQDEDGPFSTADIQLNNGQSEQILRIGCGENGQADEGWTLLNEGFLLVR